MHWRALLDGGHLVEAIESRGGFMTWIRPYLKWNLAAMLVLGFASGLPLMMVFSKLSFWLREVGVDRAVIGGFYAVSLAYSLKVFWAPVVDRLRLPVLTRLLGQRRSWMLVAILGVVAGLVIIGLSTPSPPVDSSPGAIFEALGPTLVGAFLLAYAGATVDITVDAWRIESAPDDEQANMAAVYILGYRLAMMFSGVGLMIAGWASWMVAYGVMALVMLGVAGLVLVIREPPREVPEVTSFVSYAVSTVVEPFFQLLRRFGIWFIPVILVVGLYRLSDFTMGTMASPFYSDLGYTKEAVGLITGVFGPWPIIVGGFLGGFVAVRFKLLPALLIGAVITLLTNAAFASLALAAGPGVDLLGIAKAVPPGLGGAAMCLVHGAAVSVGLPVVGGLDVAGTADLGVVLTPPDSFLFVVIVADNLAAGYVGTVFVAFMSSLTDREYAATQYALFSSAFSLFCKLVASTTAGPLVESVGWAPFYVVTALFALPSAGLIVFLMVYGPPQVKGVRDASPEQETG